MSSVITAGSEVETPNGYGFVVGINEEKVVVDFGDDINDFSQGEVERI